MTHGPATTRSFSPAPQRYESILAGLFNIIDTAKATTRFNQQPANAVYSPRRGSPETLTAPQTPTAPPPHATQTTATVPAVTQHPPATSRQNRRPIGKPRPARHPPRAETADSATT